MLRYIVGRAGSGKSYQVLGEIKQSIEQGSEEPLILLVPEQYTLQAERDLIQKLQLPGIMQVEVLSFTRLAQRVFAEVGGLTRVMIDEQGKHMILRRVINQNLNLLTIYKQAAKQAGFVNKCGQIISDLKQYDVDAVQLTDHPGLNAHESVLVQKIHDIAIIYEAFNQYLQGRTGMIREGLPQDSETTNREPFSSLDPGLDISIHNRYIDMDDYTNLLIEKLGQSRYLKGSRIWIDNFATFSPQSLRIIEQLINLAGELTVVLSRDPGERSDNSELFALSDHAYRKIHHMAVKLGVPEQLISVSAPETVGRSPELRHLERQLYAFPSVSWDNDISHLHIFAGANIFSEVEYMAASMVARARDDGWRWRDMAVICQDLSTYGPIITRVFREYNIPCFMDEKREIIDHPIIQFVLSSLDIVQRGYRREDICRCCKTGFTFLNPQESDEWENYLLRYGLQGKRLKEDFGAGPSELLPYYNGIRIRLMEPLLRLEDSLAQSRDLGGITRALYEYLREMDVAERLAREIEAMKLRGWWDKVLESTQIWNIVMDTLDQLYTIMGDQPINLKEYRQMLEAGFLSYELGIIPTTVDQVLVGSVQRSISQNIRALFVLGVNDGVLPGGHSEDSLLDEDERSRLEKLGIELGLSRELKMAQENYLIYSALSKASEEIWFSYALADSEGRALRPSLLMNRVRQIFITLQPVSDLIQDRQTGLNSISTPGSTMKYLVQNLRLGDEGRGFAEFWWDVYRWYGEHQPWQARLDSIIRGFGHRNQVGNLRPELSEKLYARPFRTSVSRLEQYANCPFAHFVRYGMRPAERKTFEVSAPDIGDLFHGAFQNLAGKMAEQGLAWQELSRDQCDSLMDTVMDEMAPGHAEGVFASTHRYRYLVNRLKRIGRRSAWTLAQHIQAGEFRPLGYEMRFGRGGDLPAIEIVMGDGEKLYLEGWIDRADLYQGEEGSYVRVIDYKTGPKAFDLSSAYYGLSLQLLVYMMALLGKKQSEAAELMKPAGVFYFRVDDPAIKSDSSLQEEIEKQIAQKLRMDGLVLKDVNIIRAMDRELEGTSSIIPVSLKKDGDFDAYSPVLDEEEFAQLLRHVEVLLRQISQEILRGRARIEPVMINQRKACDYCGYQTICQFDQLFENNRYRRLPQLRRGEVLARIAGGQPEGEAR